MSNRRLKDGAARLGNDAVGRRSASTELRGFEYQLYRSVLEWLDLSAHQQLFLERAEDIEIRDSANVLYTDVKNRTAAISLGRAEVVRSLANYWELREHSSLKTVYRYVTTAGIGIEAGRPFGEGVSGIELWRSIARSSSTPAGSIEKLRAFLLDKESLGPELMRFLRHATCDEIKENLIVPFDWIAGEPGTQKVEDAARTLISDMAAAHNIPATESDAILAQMVRTVLMVAARQPDRPLTRNDLQRMLEAQANRLVPRADLQKAVALELGRLLSPGDARTIIPRNVALSAPPVPADYVRRPTLYARLQQIVGIERVAIVTGTQGVGKSALAKDFAGDQMWRWVSLRNRTTMDACDVLSRLLSECLDSPDMANVVLDDVEFGDDSAALADAIARLLEVLSRRDGRVILTSSFAVPARLSSAVGIHESNTLQVPYYTREEIEELIGKNVAPQQSSGWARMLFAASGGHPTLIAGWIRACSRVDWQIGRLSEIERKPQEVQDVEREVRRTVDLLDASARELLLRLSLCTAALSRQQVIALSGQREPINDPGMVLDRIVGPWLEIASQDGSVRPSPLILNLAFEVRGSDYVRNVHWDVAKILLDVKQLDLESAAGVLFHGVRGRNEDALGLLLASALREDSEQLMRNLARAAPYFATWELEDADWSASLSDELRIIIRATQFRMATELGDPKIWQRVLDAFEREFPPGAKVQLRFAFQGYVLIHGRQTVHEQVLMTIKWIEEFCGDRRIGRRLKRIGPRQRGRPASIVEMASTLILGKIRSREDLRDLLAALSTGTVDLRRAFLSGLQEETFTTRGIFGHLRITEYDRSTPKWAELIDALVDLSTFSNESGLDILARLAIGEAARITADQNKNVASALDLVKAAKSRLGDDPILQCAEAFVKFEGGDFAQALRLWSAALPMLKEDVKDNLPAEDARFAAIAAGKLERFVDAEHWILWAENHLSEHYFGIARAVYPFEAAFACWKLRQDDRAVQHLARGLERLSTIDPMESDITFNSFKRLGHVLAWMTQDRLALSRRDYHAPTFGDASRIDEMSREDFPPATFGAIVVLACSYEVRASSSFTLWNKYSETAAHVKDPVVPVLSRMMRVGATLQRGQFDSFADVLVDCARGLAASVDAASGGAIDAAYVDANLPVGILAAIDHQCGASSFENWLQRLVASGYAAASKLLAALISLLGESERAAVTALASPSSTSETRAAAALVLGTGGSASPVQFAVCLQYWVQMFANADDASIPGHILAAVVKKRGPELLAKKVTFADPRQTFLPFVGALERDAHPWDYVGRVLDALEAAVATPLSEDIKKIIAVKIENEHRWFDER